MQPPLQLSSQGVPFEEEQGGKRDHAAGGTDEGRIGHVKQPGEEKNHRQNAENGVDHQINHHVGSL